MLLGDRKCIWQLAGKITELTIVATIINRVSVGIDAHIANVVAPRRL